MAHLSNIGTLARIGLKPGASLRDRLTIARHVLRQLCAEREAIHDERHALRRKANQLRRHLPFTRLAVERMEQQARDHRADELKLLRPVLLAYGQSLIHDRDGYMAALGFDAVCDLLNVNRVEREQARADGVDDLAGLIFVHNLEDSASHRGEDSKRGPLFEACYSAFCEFIRTAPPGTLPDPFAPGAPFGPKLPPALRIVGK
ncbi:hypothetical protein [Pseudomonas sp. AN-1]|uniref:hypothetical protein n=1 Tax=Pseudomonas sp. AN-1 TaxID=3096605 RepID=UPI002A69B964|nr:hypothetical protein [Pseudomonas sp. AN-1]WPP47261.1 hypothetical protein SK095_07765 [Pseudomonas sp. AN-1]